MLLLPEDIPLQGEAEEEEAAAPVVVQKPVFQPADTTSLMPQLKNSLDTILTYVKAEPEFAGAFRTLITDYRLLPDRNSEEPAAKKSVRILLPCTLSCISPVSSGQANPNSSRCRYPCSFISAMWMKVLPDWKMRNF